MSSREFARRRVVIVDDEAGLRDLFTEILGPAYDVKSFDGPEQFLNFIKDHTTAPFEILITDLKMPGMSGMEMVRQAQGRGLYFPSILMSGYLDKNSIYEAVDLGVYRILEKPAPPEKLISAVEELLVEYDIRDVRQEIRGLTGQLREYYSFLRVLIMSRVPEAEVNSFSLQTNKKGEVVTQENFDQLLNRLESRLEKLLRSENVLEDVRAKRQKKTAA